MATKMKFNVDITGSVCDVKDENGTAVLPQTNPVTPPTGGFREMGLIQMSNSSTPFLRYNVKGASAYILQSPHTMKIQVNVATSLPDFITDENGNPVNPVSVAADAEVVVALGGYRPIANVWWYQGSTCTVLNVIGGGQYLFCI